MKIKKTTIVETKERGRVTRRVITTVETRESYTDWEYDQDTMRGVSRVANCPMSRIMEAYRDYRLCDEW